MKKYFFIIALSIICFDYGFCQWNPTIHTKTKKIKLSTFESDSYFVYENKSSIIYIDKMKVVENISNHLKNKKLCELRKLNYEKILQRLNASDSSFFVIETTMSPEILKQFGGIPDLDTTTGYKPLDYYSEKLKMNISKEYIPPYGFKIEIDTTEKLHLNKYYAWMISELILSGNAKIYNKQTDAYEKIVFFEIVSFSGHGGETLLFSNKDPFYAVDTYSDISIPDYECGDDYEGYEIIE